MASTDHAWDEMVSTDKALHYMASTGTALLDTARADWPYFTAYFAAKAAMRVRGVATAYNVATALAARVTAANVATTLGAASAAPTVGPGICCSPHHFLGRILNTHEGRYCPPRHRRFEASSVKPRLFSEMASYDVASNICQAYCPPLHRPRTRILRLPSLSCMTSHDMVSNVCQALSYGLRRC
jgi:hypothetical protein